MTEDLCMLSRSGWSNPMGKLYPMPKVGLTETTLELLRTKAANTGMPFSEYVRLVLESHVHGPDHVARVAAERVRMVVGMGVGMGSDTSGRE